MVLAYLRLFTRRPPCGVRVPCAAGLTAVAVACGVRQGARPGSLRCAQWRSWTSFTSVLGGCKPWPGWLRGARLTEGGALGCSVEGREGVSGRKHPPAVVLPSSGPVCEKGPVWDGGLGPPWRCARRPSDEAGPSASWRVGRVSSRSAVCLSRGLKTPGLLSGVCLHPFLEGSGLTRPQCLSPAPRGFGGSLGRGVLPVPEGR